MILLQTFRTCVRPLALVIGTGWLVSSTGCYNWAVAPEGTAVATQQTQGHLRLTLTDGRTMDLLDARMIGDSLLIGMTAARGRATVPVALVRTVEVSHMDTGKTVGLVAGIVAGLGAGLLALVAIAMDRGN